MLGQHVFLLANADTMLACHRTTQLDGHQVQRLGKRMRLLKVGLDPLAKQDNQMEIAITDMPEDGRDKT